MIICESEFTRPDPKNPNYALHEVDIYGHLPYAIPQQNQHRLAIRKNLKTNTFEAYKHYFIKFAGQEQLDEVVCSGTLAQITDYTNAEVERQWGKSFTNQDQACDHEHVVSKYCQVKPCPTST
jgi:hypothetical protein